VPCVNKEAVTISIPVIRDALPYWSTLFPFNKEATPTHTKPIKAMPQPYTWCLQISNPFINFDRIQVEMIEPPDNIWLIDAGISNIDTI